MGSDCQHINIDAIRNDTEWKPISVYYYCDFVTGTSSGQPYFQVLVIILTQEQKLNKNYM
jgi:hypothetical protein